MKTKRKEISVEWIKLPFPKRDSSLQLAERNDCKRESRIIGDLVDSHEEGEKYTHSQYNEATRRIPRISSVTGRSFNGRGRGESDRKRWFRTSPAYHRPFPILFGHQTTRRRRVWKIRIIVVYESNERERKRQTDKEKENTCACVVSSTLFLRQE